MLSIRLPVSLLVRAVVMVVSPLGFVPSPLLALAVGSSVVWVCGW